MKTLEYKLMSHYHWIEKKTLVLHLRAIPGAQRTHFAGISGEVLRVKLNAQPRDNEANEVLIHFLAKAFGIAKSQVSVISGAKSRLKRVSLVNPTILPLETEITMPKVE